jgi:hypothetical protein
MEVFPRWHDDAGAAPEVRTKRLGFGRIRAGFVLASFTHGSDLAKGMSHDGQSPTPSEAGWTG